MWSWNWVISVRESRPGRVYENLLSLEPRETNLYPQPGACVSYPSSKADGASSSNTTQSGQRQCIASLDTTRLTPSELTAELIRGMNLTTTTIPSEQYNASLSSLIQAASVLRGAGLFSPPLPIAAFSLLTAAGLLFIIPLFFNLARRRKICNVLLLLAALCASLGLMLAGASTVSLLQVQAAQRVVGTLSLPGASAETVFVGPGRVVAPMLRYGLGLAATFVVLIAIMAFMRHGGHLNDRPPSTRTKAPVAGAGAGRNKNRNWVQWDAQQQSVELPRYTKQVPGKGFPAPRGRQTRNHRY